MGRSNWKSWQGTEARTDQRDVEGRQRDLPSAHGGNFYKAYAGGLQNGIFEQTLDRLNSSTTTAQILHVHDGAKGWPFEKGVFFFKNVHPVGRELFFET